MPSCLRLDVGGLSKVLASRRARRSSRGATRGVESRRQPPLELGNQSRRAAGAPGVSLSRGMRRRERASLRGASRRPSPPSLPAAAFGRLPRDLPAQVTRGSYGGAGPSRQKNCRFARKSGTPGSGGQEGGQGARAPSDDAFPRERAHPPLTAERQPAPKSAPVSQDSKRRGGSPTERHRICTRARAAFPRESQRCVPRRVHA